MIFRKADWIHEVECLSGQLIGGQRRSHAEVFGVIALDHHIGFVYGIGLVVDPFAVQVHIFRSPNFAVLVLDEILRFGKHSATCRMPDHRWSSRAAVCLLQVQRHGGSSGHGRESLPYFLEKCILICK
jgi:hypothetical protein